MWTARASSLSGWRRRPFWSSTASSLSLSDSYAPTDGRARRFEARGAIAAVLGQIWRWVLPGVRRVDAGEAVRGRCLLDGCQHPSRVRGVRESRGSRLGLVLHCLARAAAAAGSPQLLGTPRR